MPSTSWRHLLALASLARTSSSPPAVVFKRGLDMDCRNDFLRSSGSSGLMKRYMTSANSAMPTPAKLRSPLLMSSLSSPKRPNLRRK